MVDGIMAGQIHMGGKSMDKVGMHDAMQTATVVSAGSQVNVGENSAVQNGTGEPEVGSVAEYDGLRSSLNDDNKVILNGHGSEAADKRNEVSSQFTPQSFGTQYGVNAVTFSVGNEGSGEGSLEEGDLVEDNLGVSHSFLSVDKSTVGESELK
ncbi:hypothetical protein FGB62_224g02 [Gracilaria domingensis]|nr:hypothetical protein FGB62_224g02 [Gracilaria domingensis]